MGEELNNSTIILTDKETNKVIFETNTIIPSLKFDKESSDDEYSFDFCKEFNFEMKLKLTKKALKQILGDKLYNKSEYDRRVIKTNELYKKKMKKYGKRL